MITYEEIMAEIEGVSLTEFRKDVQMRERHAEIGRKYWKSLPSTWSEVQFNWDLCAEAQRFALDGESKEKFSKVYPVGFILGYVNTKKFDRYLCHYNRRRGLRELWRVGDKGKLARLLAYLEDGLPITPPLVGLMPDKKQFLLIGGNHRYTVAKFSGLKTIPIYVEPENQKEIDEFFPVEWSG